MDNAAALVTPANTLDHATFAAYAKANPHSWHIAIHEAEYFTAGMFATLCAHVERDPGDFARAHPDLWQTFIPAAMARDFLAGGA